MNRNIRWLYDPAPISIPQSYVDQFSRTIHMLVEQSSSRLLRTVMSEQVTGETFTLERLGGIAAVNEITDLGGDTPMGAIEHSRRIGYIKSYEVPATLLTKQSQVRMLIDPKSEYTMRHASVMGRAMDNEIIRALGGTTRAGKEGELSVALPSDRKIAVGSGAAARLTVDKLREAAARLDELEVEGNRYFIVTARGIQNLLEDPEVTSADYNTVRALVNGQINSYMGFEFIRLELLPTIAAGVRAGYAYVQSAVKLGIAEAPNSRAAERPDKRHAWQLYTCGQWGSLRTEEARVVEVAYNPAGA